MKSMSRTIPAKLQRFFKQVEDCAYCREQKNSLRHILGGGRFYHPKYFFLFINPTHKNRSSHTSYQGQRRYPFIGVRHLYKGLAEAGFVDLKLIDEIYEKGWQVPDEERIETSLRENNVYISNFVKCAQPNPINPSRQRMREGLPLLAEELRIVNPQYIITFGLLPLETLTRTTWRLRDILDTARKGTYGPLSVNLEGRIYKVLPCYYPLGHGNPPKAQKILAYIKTHF